MVYVCLFRRSVLYALSGDLYALLQEDHNNCAPVPMWGSE